MQHNLTAVRQLTVHVACEIILIIVYRIYKLIGLKYRCFSGYSVRAAIFRHSLAISRSLNGF